MILLMSVAIIVFGVGAVLLAFSGDTIIDSEFSFGGDQWTTGKETSFFNRITARGWFSLICLSIALGLVFVREKVSEQMGLDLVVSVARLEEENAKLQARVSKQVADIAGLQMQVSQEHKKMSEIDGLIETHHLKSIEAAFSLSGKAARERDEALVQIDGRAEIPIPSRYQEQMRLYGGDRFYFSGFIQGASEEGLQSIQLVIDEKTYPLFKEKVSGFFERTLRIPGSVLRGKRASIQNPLLLNNITLKIFIHPRPPAYKDDVFKTLLKSSPFSEIALKTYKHVNADMLNMRSRPSAKSELVARLPRASFVRVVQNKTGWTEVVIPDRKQGWVTSQFLAEIQ